MTFSRPSVPSRGSEIVCFGGWIALNLAVLGLLLWDAFQGRASWRGAFVLWSIICVGSLPLLVIGATVRWQRRRKEAELREYERGSARAYQD